ncbi:carbohydrate ABC transporter permease [Cellulomonas sp. McL0617]|uniref:carbohydrate ABC transporter permease n=1 Tax=Cellulomonas sp. McL0617 TaxID=3415675 RepID=UPI003CEA0A48
MTGVALSPAPTVTPVGPRPSRRRQRRRPEKPVNLVATVIAVVVGMIFILPAVWIFVGSLRPDEETFASLGVASWRMVVPRSVSLDNYAAILTNGFGRALANSVVVCLLTVAIGLVVTVLAAYALAVLRFPGRRFAFGFVVIAFMVPFEAIAIPLSSQFTDWHLSNTLIALVLPGIGDGLAIFNLRQFFLGVPGSFREAAKIDGAAEPRILASIYLPMSGAALVNSALLIFLGQWSAYLWPLLIVSDPHLQVAPIALAKTFSEHSASYGQNFAGSVMLALVPAVLMFVLLRFFGGLSINSGEK